MGRYGRYNRQNYGGYRASKHISDRRSLSSSLGGIDKDVEEIFLNLPHARLECVFLRYGQEHGASALSYARMAYPRWKAGTTKMSGMVAERLLNLVPLSLDSSTRFELVKKLRGAHMRKERRSISCEPTDWRSRVEPIIADLLTASRKFRLPQHAVDRVRWLADGDSIAAQRLLVAAEQEEASIRLQYLEAEFKRIDAFLKAVEGTTVVNHTIELPQGTICVSIIPPRKGFFGWLGDLFS